jgi:cytochrome c oxidase subunit 3/cytochrome o ubiquinol oxidase subunit 3
MSQAFAPHPSEATSLGVDNRKLGVWTLLGSEAVFFSALIVTYIVMRGKSVSGPLPHEALDVPLTAVNTFVLICSSLTMVTALAAIQRGETYGLCRWLIATALLGLAFLSGQALEFSKLFGQGLSLSSNLFGATFFTLTGFHGAHVFAGVIWISFVLARAFRGGVTRDHHLAVELVGLYWHFVDLVWIIIFTIVYLI